MSYTGVLIHDLTVRWPSLMGTVPGALLLLAIFGGVFHLGIARITRQSIVQLSALLSGVRWIRVLLVSWLLVSIPAVVLLMGSSRVRETATAVIAEHRAPQIVMVGDSLTYGGGNWAGRLGLPPFTARNLGRGGFTAAQMMPVMELAAAQRPPWIALCAGANDVVSSHYDEQKTVADMAAMIETAHAHGVRVVLTTLPQRRPHLPRVEALNRSLQSLHPDAVVDLNPIVAPEGVLLDEFTTDGVHFSQAGYREWARALQLVID